MNFAGGVSKETYFLDICDATAARQKVLLEKERVVDYSALHMDEMEMDFIWTRFAVSPDGTIYVAPRRNEYRIEVTSPEGTVERVITRPYRSLERDAEQKEIARQIHEAIAAYYPAPLQKLTIEDTAADVAALYAAPGGELWVQTSRGAAVDDEGVFCELDVFDPAGTFQRQLVLEGPGDASRDALYVLRDGRLIVVAGALDAFLTQQGVGQESTGAGQETAPLEVICYTLEE
jgi:hypothetical protein